MKKIILLACVAVGGVLSLAPTITPGGGTIAGGGSGGVNSNFVYNMIQTTAPTNGGTTPAQVGAQIGSSNANVFNSQYINQQSGTGTNPGLGSLTIVNGAYTNRYYANGSFLRSNNIAPFDWEFHGTNGTLAYGTNNVTQFSLTRVGLLTTISIIGTTFSTLGGTFSVDNSGQVVASRYIGQLDGSYIDANSLPVTAADETWPNRTNYVAYTNAVTAGHAVVIVGRDEFGSMLLKDTNWPSGGGTAPDGLVTNISPLLVTTTNSGFSGTNSIFQMTNNVNKATFRSDTNAVVSVGTNGADTIVANPAAGFTVNTGTSNWMGGMSVISNIWTSTNVAPTSVTIGTTPPDYWMEARDLKGNLFKSPVWTNH